MISKGSNIKAIGPNNPNNWDIAVHGEFAGTEVLRLYEHYWDLQCGLPKLVMTEKLLDSHELEIAEIVVQAIRRRDSAFFTQLAKLVEGLQPDDDSLEITSKAWAHVIFLQQMEAEGTLPPDATPLSQMTRSKLLELLRTTVQEIDDRTLSRIIRQTGVKLAKSRAGRPIESRIIE
jgi:hypothetical protein